MVSHVLAARVEDDAIAAERMLDLALELDPLCSWAHYGRAHALLRQDWKADRWSEAQSSLDEALARDPGHLRARRLQAWMHAQEGATELSVSPARGQSGLVGVQTRGFGATTVALRFADAPEGPWTALDDAFRPTESDRQGVLVYAAKGHPQLVGADLVVTYASNAFDVADVLAAVVIAPSSASGKLQSSRWVVIP